MAAADFKQQYTNQLQILDVRRPGEFEGGHLPNADNKPLDYINDWTGLLNPQQTYYVHCAGGYRSVIAASILKARG